MLTYSRRKTLKKYRELMVEGSVWSKSDIQGFSKLVSSTRFTDTDKEYKAAILELWEVFTDADLTFAITQEQTDFGIKWLKDTCFKKNGEARESQKVASLGFCDFSIIMNFDHFRFIGYHTEGIGHHNWLSGPVYRVVDTDGNYFDYCVAGPWGSLLTDHEIQINCF